MAPWEVGPLDSGIDARLADLIGDVRGEVIRPGNAAADAARSADNPVAGERPTLVVRAVDVADVIATVAFASDGALGVVVGDDAAERMDPGSGAAHVVLDLSSMTGVRVDPDARTVRVAPGCTWGDVDHATWPFRLAVPGAVTSTTGVVGQTLRGGVGHLSRRVGLTIDSLLAADIVLADGRLVTTSANEHPELFWALRGGGGGLGVVTSLLFRLHPVGHVTAGQTFWPVEQAPAVMRWYRDFIQTAPEELNGILAFVTVPPVREFPPELHGRVMCSVIWCYLGRQSRADRAIAPAREVGTPALHHTVELAYPALQRAFDRVEPPGGDGYRMTGFVRDLPDQAIGQHAAFGGNPPSPGCAMHLYPINGAVQRVGREATAFRHRDAIWMLEIVGVGPDPAAERLAAWVRQYGAAVLADAAGDALSGGEIAPGPEHRCDARCAHGERLARITRAYDPGSLFRSGPTLRARSRDFPGVAALGDSMPRTDR